MLWRLAVCCPGDVTRRPCRPQVMQIGFYGVVAMTRLVVVKWYDENRDGSVSISRSLFASGGAITAFGSGDFKPGFSGVNAGRVFGEGEVRVRAEDLVDANVPKRGLRVANDVVVGNPAGDVRDGAPLGLAQEFGGLARLDREFGDLIKALVFADAVREAFDTGLLSQETLDGADLDAIMAEVETNSVHPICGDCKIVVKMKEAYDALKTAIDATQREEDGRDRAERAVDEAKDETPPEYFKNIRIWGSGMTEHVGWVGASQAAVARWVALGQAEYTESAKGLDGKDVWVKFNCTGVCIPYKRVKMPRIF